MVKMTERKNSTTRGKILEAAGEVFGQRGYKAATVREICKRAGVNVAAVNYYFQGKKGLYREVARDFISETFARFPVVAGTGKRSPEQRLGTFIEAALHRLISRGGLSGDTGRGQLVARELADPSAILDTMVEDFIRPTAMVLTEIISELLGSAASDRDVLKCQLSVIGQCFHYATGRPIIVRITGLDLSEEKTIRELADHVTRFSLAAIHGIRQQMEQDAK
jgi:TetR/AcrR family transcriptional regulator, regulator of cefoperazone and chloramphenicol sensitivity